MDGRHHDRYTRESPPDIQDASSTTSHPSDQPPSKVVHLGDANLPSGTAPTSEPSAGSFSETDATVITHEPPIPPRPNVEYLHPRELGHALEGQRLDHFELVDFIGGGGMGAVFVHTTRCSIASLPSKCSRPARPKTKRRGSGFETKHNRLPDSIMRTSHGFTSLAKIKVVHYIVFEYIEGVNIRDLVQSNGPLSIEQALSYTLQIAEALSHAGHRDVVHRDIKPSNILVTADGQAKLVDMGLARMQHLGDRDDLTATGVTLWAFDYISPEQRA